MKYSVTIAAEGHSPATLSIDDGDECTFLELNADGELCTPEDMESFALALAHVYKLMARAKVVQMKRGDPRDQS